jgi:hypothetical protein
VTQQTAAAQAARRELLVSAAFALWGLAIAMAMVAVWDRPAPPDQLPGIAKTTGFDAHGPFRWVTGLMLLPIIVPLVLRPISRRLLSGAAWARHAALIAPVVTLWLVTVHRSVFWATVPCAIVIAACTLLRHRDLGFTRRDVVLIAAFLPTFLAIVDIKPGFPADGAIYVAALLILGIRIAITFIPSPLPPALAFVAAPLGLGLQTGFFARDQRYFGWHAVAIVIITPFLLRLVLRNARRATQILVFVVYPLALYNYAHALSLGTAEGKPRVDFFEDGHALLPASEYLRGERAYRDVLPAHGLIEDGLFDVAAMKIGGVNLGTRGKARIVVGYLVTVALYAVAFAATGSAEGAFFAVLLALMTGAFTGNIRFLPALITLAMIAAAVRRRRPWLFAWAGFGTVVCGFTSLDFAAYAFVTLLVAVLRSRDQRVAATRAAIGMAAGIVPMTLILAVFGILGDFLRGTFVETLAVGPAYAMNFFTPPAAMKRVNAFPDVLAALLDRDVFSYLAWCIAALFAGVMVTRRVSRRLEPVVIVAVFIVATAVSYAERHHLYFEILAPVLAIALILGLLRRRHTALAVVTIVAAIALAAPTTHIGVIGWMRGMRGPSEPGWVELTHLPRARGAYIHERDAVPIASVEKYLALSLQPDETFFDFTNSSLLYFLFHRDCPIRQYEVAFYETEALQREVIHRIESNPKVRAALVPSTPRGRFNVDGIASEERAPLVWEYLKANFHPDFEEGEVVFWRRNVDAPAQDAVNPNSLYTVYVRYPKADSPARPAARRLLAELTALGFDARESLGESPMLWDEVRVDHAPGHRVMAEKIREVVQRTLIAANYQTKTVLVRQDNDRKSTIIWVLF